MFPAITNSARQRSRLFRRGGRSQAARVAVLGVVGLISASLSTACAESPGQPPQEPSPSNERFYEQELSFGSCAGYGTTSIEKQVYVAPFECARLLVPLNYADPDGETMKVAVIRRPAQGAPDQRIGSLVLNPGGPGGSGMSQAVLASASLADTPTVQRFDIVGFDPRGVGSSTPAIHCFTSAERDGGRDQTTLLGTSGSWQETDTRALADKCAQNSGGEQVLSAVGTRNVARDMDVLRAALGDEKLTFAGQSYGTRLGAVYAEMYPRNVRAMVLDGAVDPASGNAERRLTQQAGFQRSFDLLAASCTSATDCPLGNDPSGATATFQQLVQPLINAPIPAGESRTLNFNQATGAITAGLYDSANWPALIAGMKELGEGRGDTLLAIYDQFSGRDPAGQWSNFIEANLAINCNDEDRRTPDEEAALRKSVMDVSPFIATGEGVDANSRDACEFWPGQPSLGIPYAQGVKGLPDTLVISITGDPATPYEAGENLAKALGGTVLPVEGERHTVAQAGISACVNDVFAAYLIDLKTPQAGQRCVL